MPRLACLGLFEAGEEVTDAGLAHLASLRGSLTALDMGYSTWSHTPAGLQQLLARLTGLRLLNIGALAHRSRGARCPACTARLWSLTPAVRVCCHDGWRLIALSCPPRPSGPCRRLRGHH